MGKLTPGASFSYEKHGPYTIATDVESNERSIIGYDYSQNYATTREHMRDDKFWGAIRREAKTNVALQRALDRAIMIYNLSKESHDI